jgi:hypothetical protein
MLSFAFSTGSDLGYLKGTLSSSDANYQNGVQDGLDICLDSINRRVYKFDFNKKEDETL